MAHTGCKQNTKTKVIEKTVTLYLIRHAEKDRSDPSDKNPPLTPEGQKRALKWAEVFKEANLKAVYSTNYKRTLQTAEPSAKQNGLKIEVYDPYTLNFEELKEKHNGGSILIVGHSNTTPMLVNKLLGTEKYKEIDDAESGALFTVTLIGKSVNSTLLYIN